MSGGRRIPGGGTGGLAWVCTVLCGALLTRDALAIPPSELVQQAVTAEQHGDPRGAARALEELVAAGVDGSDVLYDLGIARAEGGRLGEAVWCLEQVSRRSPLAFSAQRSLRAVRVRIARRDAARTGAAVVEAQGPLTVQIGELLPYDVSVPLGVVAELAVMAAWWARRRTPHEITRVGATVAAILAGLVAVFSLGVVAARRTSPATAIVLHDGQRLLQAPRVDGIPDASVREGERVDLLASEGGFLRVRTPTGRAGWLPVRDVGTLAE